MNNAFFEDRILSVSDVCRLLSDSLGEMFWGLNVEGEVCNFKINSSRHWYFSIKDEKGSLLNCTCFASRNWNLDRPGNGDVVVLSGSLSFWAKGGSLSFNVDKLRKKGAGDLMAEIEKRRAYYQGLGYFDAERKRKLPETIGTIGVVTSDTGAVIHDILNITRRRAPGTNIMIFPCMVQGSGAAETIASRIRQANNFSACDVLIIARGGGSGEDLAPYSSAEVIEAVYRSVIPVISAVGHDSDFPLSDFVADVRASTPSAAAELATERAYRHLERLHALKTGLEAAVLRILNTNRRRLGAVTVDKDVILRKLMAAGNTLKEAGTLERIMAARIHGAGMQMDGLMEEARTAIRTKVKQDGDKLARLQVGIGQSMRLVVERTSSLVQRYGLECRMHARAMLDDGRKRLGILVAETDALNPLAILSRGYSIATDESGRVVRNIGDTKAGETLIIRVRDGRIKAETKEISKEI